jgi:hypothetical protein
MPRLSFISDVIGYCKIRLWHATVIHTSKAAFVVLLQPLRGNEPLEDQNRSKLKSWQLHSMFRVEALCDPNLCSWLSAPWQSVRCCSTSKLVYAPKAAHATIFRTPQTYCASPGEHHPSSFSPIVCYHDGPAAVVAIIPTTRHKQQEQAPWQYDRY